MTERISDVADHPHRWSGTGRWLSFVAAAVLLLFSIPLVFSEDFGAAAGWNIFLALLLIGGVASDNAAAPEIATGIAVLMLFRLALVPVLGGGLLDFLFGLLPFGLTTFAAMDLRKQAKTV